MVNDILDEIEDSEDITPSQVDKTRFGLFWLTPSEQEEIAAAAEAKMRGDE